MDEKTVEIDQIDTRYQLYRLPNKRRERDLLSSIGERGIDSPLLGVMKGEAFVLLDGFKRFRCAKKLGINSLHVEGLGTSEGEAIIKLLKISNDRSLHIIEQIKLVDELHRVHGIKVREIADRLERSVGWVGMRLGILKEFDDNIWQQIFLGNLPATTVMYTLRQFKRLNKIPNLEINQFVDAVAGKRLGYRDIDTLAHAWFKGGAEVKEQIKKGDIAWTLDRAKELNSFSESSFGDTENRILKDLEITQKYMGRVIFKLPLYESDSDSFMATAGLLAEGILEKTAVLSSALNKFIKEAKSDRCREKKGDMGTLPRRNECRRTFPATGN